jgi:hypothetical protein
MWKARGPGKKWSYAANGHHMLSVSLSASSLPGVGLAGDCVTPQMVVDYCNGFVYGQVPITEGVHHEPAGLSQGQDGHSAPFFAKR